MRYVYDAWGKVKIQRDTTEFKLSRINPFLWRGYIYDYDTGLYYLQSRYYDPELCRFLNLDDPAILLLEDSISPNVYAYCHNDPVNNVDSSGYFSISRSMLSMLLDVMFMSISPLLALIKAFAKIYAGFALKTRISTPLINLIKHVASISTKILNSIKNIVNKIPILGKNWQKNKCYKI